MAALTTIWLTAFLTGTAVQEEPPSPLGDADLGRCVQAAYQEAAQLLGVTSPPSPGRVQSHEDDAGYEQAGGALGSLAFLTREDRVIHVRRPEAFIFEMRQELLPEVRPVLRHVIHEGVRQFLLTAFPQAAANPEFPAWLEEGICEYVSASADPEAGTFARHSAQSRYGTANLYGIQRLFRGDGVPRMPQFLTMSREDFAARLGDHTKISWAVAHFLWNSGQPEGGGGEFAGLIPALLIAFNEGLGAQEAYTRVWSGRGTLANVLQQRMESYYRRHEGYLPDRAAGRFRVRETEHYTMYLDTSLGERATEALLANFGIRMELMFVKYGEAFQYSGKMSQKAVLRVYPDRQQFQAGEGVDPGVAAFYRPETKELVGFQTPPEVVPNFFNIFCHEGSHQFFDVAFPGFYKASDLPMWFSEGMGDCLGSCEVGQRRTLYVFYIDRGIAACRIDMAKQLVEADRHVPLRELITYDYQQFYGGAGRLPAVYKYAQAWSLLHFLWMYPGYGEEGEHYYRASVARLVRGFKEGRPRDEIYQEAFRVSGRAFNWDEIEEQWKEYVRRMPNVNPR